MTYVIMMLTEFEKTILLSLFVLAKGSTKKYVSLDLLLSKFPIRQRRMVRRYVEKLVKEKFLIKHKTKESYKIARDTLKIISTYLVTGPKVRI